MTTIELKNAVVAISLQEEPRRLALLKIVQPPSQ